MSDHRPRQHAFESPDLAKVVQQINCQVIGELLAAAGGEVVLPPGFADRIGNPTYVVYAS